ncbi:hypothetical protein IFM89_012067 [Coptis chinensis]|uniref:Uncharacterized protein n=1 Tax=Coptis chinensis TaxID=261450 RepID=A0A835I1M6_9MAGN|nr:hypothetical protein IFM89_012067 [Coptis chinensis]
MQLFNEGNYETALFCFKRSGDVYCSKWAQAASLQMEGENKRHKDFEMAATCLSNAAELYEEIGKFESSAACFLKFGNYEKACAEEVVSPKVIDFEEKQDLSCENNLPKDSGLLSKQFKGNNNELDCENGMKDDVGIIEANVERQFVPYNGFKVLLDLASGDALNFGRVGKRLPRVMTVAGIIVALEMRTAIVSTLIFLLQYLMSI